MVTAEDHPDLWESVSRQHLFDRVWPEYNLHGNHAGRYFGALVPDHAKFQLLFIDERTGQVVARGRTIPFRWDGTLDDLPAGIDAVGIRAITEPAPPSALSALAAEVDPSYQGSGLSALLLTSMRSVAQLHGLAPLVAPVRPSWKDRYPLTPIERFSDWRRDDGLLPITADPADWAACESGYVKPRVGQRHRFWRETVFVRRGGVLVALVGLGTIVAGCGGGSASLRRSDISSLRPQSAVPSTLP